MRFFRSYPLRAPGIRVVKRRRKRINGIERLVLDTAGLSDDALHVLNLSLAAAEGTELESMLAFGSSVRYTGLLAGDW